MSKPTYKEFIELELENTKDEIEKLDAKLMLAEIVYETQKEMLIKRQEKLEEQLGMEK